MTEKTVAVIGREPQNQTDDRISHNVSNDATSKFCDPMNEKTTIPENLDDLDHCPQCGYIHKGDNCPSGEQNRRPPK